MIRALVVCAVLASACKSDGGNSDLGSTEVAGSGSAKAAGSAGGFSATLSSDLAKGSDTPGAASGSGASGPAMAGSGSAAMAGNGSAAMAGSAVAMTGSAAKAGSGSAAMVGSGSAAMAGSRAKAGSGAGSAAIAGSAAKAGSGAGSAVAMAGSAAKAGSGAGPAAMAGSAAKPIDKPKPVQVSGDLAAIKISLLPNWVRDVDEAGTISLTVTVQSRNEVATFRFHYGYDLAGAPNDREQYKKFLMAQKVMAVTADRQRGAAWYLEGVDSDGKASFRFLTTYGGKRLVCYGSLYKDSGLGDIRDEVIIQAKKICETLAL